MIIPILFEDDNLLIINKPSGVVVHPFDHSTEETIIDHLYTSYPELATVGSETISLQDGRVITLGGVVHKLDRETSGIMVFAKNTTTQEYLTHLFRNHTIYKQYVALIEGVVTADELRINAPLGRNKKEYKQVAFPENPRGALRDAITDLKVIIRGKDSTLVSLEPLTGRTHQLRAHMSHILDLS